MRHLVTGPRRSGRTTNFILELPEEAENINVVAASFHLAMMIKYEAARLRGMEFAAKIRPIGLDSLENLRGVDPYSIFFEHTAYEMASSSQLRTIYYLEDRADPWNGDLE